MNVITAYLETMFGAYPPTPRMLEAKAELHAMMEDAYSESIARGLSENEAVGRVITEFGNLDELAPQLGITTEIAPVDGHVGEVPPSREAVGSLSAAPVTQEEAEQYAAARRRTDPRLALATAMFVVAPAPLIALSTLSAGGVIGIGQQLSAFIGLGCLMVVVVIGVLVIIRRSGELAPFARLTNGEFTRSPGIDRWAGQLAADVASKRTTAQQIAIGLWILAAVPVLAMSLLAPPAIANAWIGVAVAAMLVMVAVGLFVFIGSGWAESAAETLTKSGRAAARLADAEAERHSIVGVVAAFYWPLVVAIFLAWSLIGDAWDRSWIIWPIAAVLFGAIAGGLSAVERRRAVLQ